MKEKGKGCRSYRGYKEDRAFWLSFKRRLDKVTAKKKKPNWASFSISFYNSNSTVRETLLLMASILAA
ncbi:MAG: hypothetical protein EAZ58_09910, partial [Flavobacterium sp.]